MRRLYHRAARCSIPSLALAAAAMPAAAQDEDAQLWLQANANVPLGEKAKLTAEQITRFSADRLGGLYTTEFGLLGSYKVAKTVELGFGYRYVGFYNGNTAADENRIRQHVIATFGPVTTRFRLDERFSTIGPGIGFRFRPLVRFNHKLGTQGWALFASHESFFLPNTTRWGQKAGYERMRNIVGVVWPIAHDLSADVGYLNQYRFGRDGARPQMDHALTFQLTVNLGDVLHIRADD